MRGERKLYSTTHPLREVEGREWQCHSLRLPTSSSNVLTVAFPGDGSTISTKLKSTERGESCRKSGPTESIPRTDRSSFENGGNIFWHQLFLAKPLVVNQITEDACIKFHHFAFELLFVLDVRKSLSHAAPLYLGIKTAVYH